MGPVQIPDGQRFRPLQRPRLPAPGPRPHRHLDVLHDRPDPVHRCGAQGPRHPGDGKVIIENIIEQGEINLERLGDGKPPFDRPGKFFSLFNPKAQNKLIAIIRSVNENARVA